MTTTNRAFIKVYRHDAPQLAPAAPAITAADRQLTAALHASIEFVAAATDGEYSSTDRLAAGTSLLATSIDVLPPPAELPVAVQLQNRNMPAERRPGKQGGQAHFAPKTLHDHCDDGARPASGRLVKRPLSAFIANHATRSATANDESMAFRVGTSVASFRWPGVCRALSKHSGPELDRVVDTMLTQAARSRPVTGVLGVFPGNGCTTTALCLAARSAGRGSRAILVDGNFYNPRVATWLDVVPTAGWQEVLENRAAVADAIVSSVEDRLDVLALSDTHCEDPLQLFGIPPVMRTAALLRQAYDLVLVDLGAFFNPRSQPIALELVRRLEIDSVLVVADPKLDPRDADTIAEHVNENGGDVLGIVENRISVSVSR
jgi:Mrp family chromosome partitioning ATPase